MNQRQSARKGATRRFDRLTFRGNSAVERETVVCASGTYAAGAAQLPLARARRSARWRQLRGALPSCWTQRSLPRRARRHRLVLFACGAKRVSAASLPPASLRATRRRPRRHPAAAAASPAAAAARRALTRCLFRSRRRSFAAMLIYKDVLSGDEMLSDSYDIKARTRGSAFA